MNLGDRMKLYESAETERKLMPKLPVCARLDGRAFHSFTRAIGCKRPFDHKLISAMQHTTARMVEEYGAKIGYTQSDEISLILYTNSIESQLPFDGKIFKLTSSMAATATAEFLAYYVADTNMPFLKRIGLPTFDCRVWQVPTKEEACNVLLWRERDAIKNSITMLAESYFSHTELMHKKSADKHEMLHTKGVNWNSLDACEKRGSYFQRAVEMRVLTDAEYSAIPPMHRPERDHMITRSSIEEVNMEIGKIFNPVEVVFEGAKPVERKENKEPS